MVSVVTVTDGQSLYIWPRMTRQGHHTQWVPIDSYEPDGWHYILVHLHPLFCWLKTCSLKNVNIDDSNHETAQVTFTRLPNLYIPTSITTLVFHFYLQWTCSWRRLLTSETCFKYIQSTFRPECVAFFCGEMETSWCDTYLMRHEYHSKKRHLLSQFAVGRQNYVKPYPAGGGRGIFWLRVVFL